MKIKISEAIFNISLVSNYYYNYYLFIYFFPLLTSYRASGPGSTVRGMSVEISLRDINTPRRVRVLFAYSPLESSLMPLEDDPSSFLVERMKLTDIVITREDQRKRPLDLDEEPDDLWRKITQEPAFIEENSFHTMRVRMAPNGKEEEVKINNNDIFPHIQYPLVVVPSQSHHESVSESLYSRWMPGGLLIEAPSVFPVLEPSALRVTWLAKEEEGGKEGGGKGEDNDDDDNMHGGMEVEGIGRVNVYSAEIVFQFVQEVAYEEGQLNLQPPRLMDFFVDKISCISRKK
jgi:hypothetical protein